jgi:hypothetical protein
MDEPSAEVSCGQRPGEERRMMTGKASVVGNYDRRMKSEKAAKDICYGSGQPLKEDEILGVVLLKHVSEWRQLREISIYSLYYRSGKL